MGNKCSQQQDTLFQHTRLSIHKWHGHKFTCTCNCACANIQKNTHISKIYYCVLIQNLIGQVPFITGVSDDGFYLNILFVKWVMRIWFNFQSLAGSCVSLTAHNALPVPHATHIKSLERKPAKRFVTISVLFPITITDTEHFPNSW